MEITSAANTEVATWIAPVTRSNDSWSSDRKPRRDTSAAVDRKLNAAPKQRYLPDPGPGHVDFYA